MRWKDCLRRAQGISLTRELPDKQHLVVCFAFEGRICREIGMNTEAAHAEALTLKAFPEADRLVVYRFNRADPTRLPRPSCPCFRCCPLIRASSVRKVEFLSPLGPVVVKVENLTPYNGKDLL